MGREERVMSMIMAVTPIERLKIRTFYGKGAEKIAVQTWMGFALFGNSHDGLADWLAANMQLGVINYLPTPMYQRSADLLPLFERTDRHAKGSVHGARYVLQGNRYVEIGVRNTHLLRWVIEGGHRGHAKIKKPQYEPDMHTLFFELTTKAARIRGLL